jgi:hypothetical protein
MSMIDARRYEMQGNKETVKCHGTIYSMEAWRLVYGYIVNNKTPDAQFEKRMRGLGVSRSDAYVLYRTQIYSPWEISFEKPRKEKNEPSITVKFDEKMVVSKRHKS